MIERPAYLRLIENNRRRLFLPRLRVRIAVSTDRCPYGRSKEFRFDEGQLAELVAAAMRIERRS